MKTEFEYFAPEVMQTSVEGTTRRDFTPLAAIQPGGPIDFFIPGSVGQYLNPSKSSLYVRAKITKANGTALVQADSVGPANLTLHSMFANVSCTLGDKLISSNDYLYPDRAYLETLTAYTPEVQANQLKTELWYKDKAGKFGEFSIAAEGANKGLVSRAEFFKLSNEVEMEGRLHIDLFHQPNAIPSNMPLRITLTPSRDQFLLMGVLPTGDGAAQDQYKFVIVEIKLYMETLKVSNALELAHEMMLQKRNIRIPLRRVQMKHVAIPQGSNTATYDNLFLGALPERAIICFKDETCIAGGYQINPFEYKNYAINYLALHVNGELVPSQPFQPDFATGKYIRELNSLYRAMGTLNTDRAIAIDRSEFSNGFTLFAFDLSSDGSSANCKSLPKSGTIRIELKFAAPLGQPVAMIVYAEFDSLIEIDKFRNVITQF